VGVVLTSSEGFINTRNVLKKKVCGIVEYVLGAESKIQTNDKTIGGQDQVIHHGGDNI
jgi:hypothetical protein